MAQLAFTLGGAAIGGAFAPGAVFLGLTGANIGAAVGGLAFNALFAPSPPHNRGPNFGDGQVTVSRYGQAIPIVYGTMAVGGNIIDASAIDTDKKTSGGGKGGPSTPKTTTYTHYADIFVEVADAEGCTYTLIKCWANGQLLIDNTATASVTRPEWLEYEWYDGSADQQRDPTFEATHGADEVPAYRDKACIGFRRFKLDEFGLSNQIAIDFKFVISRDGTNSVAEQIIDTTTVDAESETVNGITWAPYPDLVIVSLQFDGTVSTSRAGKQVFAVDPYTRTVAWSRRVAWDAPYHDNEASLPQLCSIPSFINGIQINAPGEQLIYATTHPSSTAEFLEVVDAETGEPRIRAEISETVPPQWVMTPNHSLMTVYYCSGIAGSNPLWKRLSYTGADFSGTFIGVPWTTQTIDIPSGWWRDGNVQPATDGANILCFPVVDDTLVSPGPPGVLVLDDFDYANINGASVTFEGVPVTTLSDLEAGGITHILWDETQTSFFIIGLRDADAHSQLIKVNTTGTILDSWNFNTDLGISGEIIATNNQPFGVHRGRITFGFGSNYYQISTADPTLDIKTYAKPTTSVGQGAYHPMTDRFYNWNSSDLKIIRFNTAAEGASTLEDVVDDIETRGNTYLVAGDIDNSAATATTVNGALFAQPNMSRRAALTTLASTYLFDIVQRSGDLTLVFRGSESLAGTLTDDHLGAHVSGSSQPPALTISRPTPESLPIAVTVNYVNPGQNWEQGSQRSPERQVTPDGQGSEETIDLPLSLTDDEAAQLADTLLHMRHIESETYEIAAMPSQLSTVAPAKVVALSHAGTTYTGRVDSADVVQGRAIEARIKRTEASIYTGNGVGGTVTNQDQVIYAVGSAIAIPLDIPALRGEDFNAGYYVTAYSLTPGWPGGVMFRATDGVSYAQAANIPAAAGVGVVTSMPTGVVPLQWDTQATMTVRMLSDAALTSETLDEVHADETLNAAAIGRPGRWVLMRYVSATLNAAGTYDLDELVLGIGGTEQNVATLSDNDRFVVLSESSISRIAVDSGNIGATDYLKPVTLGRSISDAVAITHSPAGVALEPYAPYSLHATGYGGDITLTCIRRDKVPPRPLWDAGNSEATESFTWNILDSSFETVRTLTSSAETVDYLSADQVTDFGVNPTLLRWEVAQVSAVVGAGTYARTTTGSLITWENAILVESPQIFLRFDDALDASTAVDTGTNGNDGTVSGSTNVLFQEPGEFNTSILMSEDQIGGQTIDCGSDTSLLNITSADFSYGVFMKWDNTPSSTTSVGDICFQTVGFRADLVETSGQIQWQGKVDFATTDCRARSELTTITLDQWYFVVFTFDSSAKTMKLYIDGTEVSSYDAQTTGVGTLATASGSLVIGTNNWRNRLDELWVVPKELSAAEVAALQAKRFE